MNEEQKPVDKSAEDEKNVKKQINSYLEVAKHKYGRVPTIEELQAMINGDENASIAGAMGHSPSDADLSKEAPEASNGPKVLGCHIYFGYSKDKDGQRKPDQKKILFYEMPQGVYNVSHGQWESSRPEILDHLPTRDMENTDEDLMQAIMHGIVDEEDYDQLDKSGILSDNTRTLWSKHSELSKLKKQMAESEELNKSEDELIDNSEYDYAYDQEWANANLGPSGFVPDYFDLPMSDVFEIQLPGDDLIAEIMSAAHSTPKLSPQMEARVLELMDMYMSGCRVQRGPYQSRELDQRDDGIEGETPVEGV